MSTTEIISQDKKIFVIRNMETNLYGLAYDFYGEKRVLQPIEFHRIEISKYSEGLLKVFLIERESKNNFIYKVGYYDELGSLSIGFYTYRDYQYEYSSDFSDSLARMLTQKFFGIANNWVYIDKSGKTILKYNADGYGFSGGYRYMSIFSGGLAAVQPASNSSDYIKRNHPNWGFMNKQGKMVIPAIYFRAGDFHEGLCSVCAENESGILKIGFINRENKMIIPLGYDWMISNGRRLPDMLPMPKFKNGLAIMVKNNKYGVINTKNEIVISFNYKELNEMEKEYPHLFE